MRIKELFLLQVLFPLAEKIKGTSASKWLPRIQEMSTWSPEEITMWQEDKLHQFVYHAYEHTTYYKQLFDSLGIRPSDIKTKEDLSKLPIITKEIVREHHDDLIPDDLNTLNFRSDTTGGTTGVPMKYYCDENTWGYVTAAKILYWRQSGYRFGDAFIALGSSSLFSKKTSASRRIYDKIRNEHPLNCVDMSDEKCAKYAEYIKKHRIRFLYGYATALYILTKYVADHNISLNIKGVFSTSEALTDNYRDLIEKTFNCRVMDYYGARDAGLACFEVQKGCYHIGYNTIVETIDEYEPNTGTLLSTNILNYSFPLIRYQLGDIIEQDNNPTEYNGQICRKVIGRTSNVIKLENGRSLSATGISMIMKEFDVKAFDFRKSGTLELTLRIKKNIGYTKEQEALIRNTFEKYIGEDCFLNIQYVENFDCLKNGKHNYFIVN